MREIYAERLSVLLEEAIGDSPVYWKSQASKLVCRPLDGSWEGVGAESAAAAAAKQNVEVTPLDRYSQGRVVSEGLQLGFAALDVKQTRRGVQELAIALEGEWKAIHRGTQNSRAIRATQVFQPAHRKPFQKPASAWKTGRERRFRLPCRGHDRAGRATAHGFCHPPWQFRFP